MRPSGLQLPGRKRQQILWSVLRGQRKPPVDRMQLRSRGVLGSEIKEELGRHSGYRWRLRPEIPYLGGQYMLNVFNLAFGYAIRQ